MCRLCPRVRLVEWSVLVLLAFSVSSASSLWAQQADDKTGKEEKTLSSLKDGWPIHVTYYPSRLKKNSAVVVLLHMRGGNRLVWTRKGGMAEMLQNQGFAVIAVDLRKHGQSKLTAVPAGTGKKKKSRKGTASNLTRFDYNLMAFSDMEAVKKFIYTEHQAGKLNMRKLAVVGAGMSAPVAVAFAFNDWLKKPHPDAPTLSARTPRGQDVQALVLLSPESNVPGLTTSRALKFLKKRTAFLVCVGNRNARKPLAEANKVYNQLKPIAEDLKLRRNWLNPFPVQLQGTDLLGKRIGIEATVQGFLKKYVGDLKNPWRSRRSKAAG